MCVLTLKFLFWNETSAALLARKWEVLWWFTSRQPKSKVPYQSLRGIKRPALGLQISPLPNLNEAIDIQSLQKCVLQILGCAFIPGVFACAPVIPVWWTSYSDIRFAAAEAAIWGHIMKVCKNAEAVCVATTMHKVYSYYQKYKASVLPHRT